MAKKEDKLIDKRKKVWRSYLECPHCGCEALFKLNDRLGANYACECSLWTRLMFTNDWQRIPLGQGKYELAVEKEFKRIKKELGAKQ